MLIGTILHSLDIHILHGGPKVCINCFRITCNTPQSNTACSNQHENFLCMSWIWRVWVWSADPPRLLPEGRPLNGSYNSNQNRSPPPPRQWAPSNSPDDDAFWSAESEFQGPHAQQQQQHRPGWQNHAPSQQWSDRPSYPHHNRQHMGRPGAYPRAHMQGQQQQQQQNSHNSQGHAHAHQQQQEQSDKRFTNVPSWAQPASNRPNIDFSRPPSEPLTKVCLCSSSMPLWPRSLWSEPPLQMIFSCRAMTTTIPPCPHAVCPDVSAMIQAAHCDCSAYASATALQSVHYGPHGLAAACLGTQECFW